MDKYADLRAALDDGWVQSIHPDTVRDMLADYDRMREALGEIADYWNRDQNDQAMYDACWHAINTANAALAQEQGGSDA